MLTTTEPRRTDIGDGLILRCVETAEDVERLALFNGKIHSPEETAMTRRLILDHPTTRPEHWLFVEDIAAKRIVSTLCLIPWRFQCGSVELTSGEMGFVGTDPQYRRRGLVRRLADRHADLLREGDFDLTHIQGIGGFYDRFGYAYSVPLIPDLRVSLAIATAAAKDARPLVFRRAQVDDAAILTAMYREAVAPVALRSCRSEQEWCYLLDGPAIGEAETWLFEDEASAPVGYFRIHKTGFGDGLIVSEVALPGAWCAGSVLGRLAEIAAAWERPYIKLEIDPACDLAVLAGDLGGHAVSSYAWQMKLVNPVSFLQKLGPVFEQRLATSMFAGLTDHVVISTYRDEMRLVFEAGKLVAVDDPDAEEGRAVSIPPSTLSPLVLGHRSIDELSDTHHDAGAPGSSRTLVRTLFPKMRAYFHTIY